MKRGVFFEQLIECIQNHYWDRKDVVVGHNQKLVDQAGIEREIDILIKYTDFPKMVAVECKDHQRPVDIEIIDAFDGKCALLPQITDKIIASSSGFTKNAVMAAKFRGIELHRLEDFQDNTFFAKKDVFSPTITYYVARLEWNITFKNSVPDEYIKQPATPKNYKDDRKVNIKKYIVHYIDKHLIQLCEEYIQEGKKPFDKIIHIPVRNRVYIEDIRGQKQSIRSFDIPIHFDMSMTSMDIYSQKKYFQNSDKQSLVITELGYQNSSSHLIMVESEYKTSTYFKNRGVLVKPTKSK